MLAGLTACSDSTSPTDAGTVSDRPAGDASSTAHHVTDLPIQATERLMGLDGAVDVVVDHHGWPHIYATTLRDAAYVQGYIMARDRFAQMDLFRRLASGTLAERFGVVNRDALGADIAARVLGLRRAAQAMWDTTPPGRTRTLLEAFTAGVNVYGRQVRAGDIKLPPGTDLVLSGGVADWTPVDSLAIGRYQSYSLSYDADDDVNVTKLTQRIHQRFDMADMTTQAARRARAGMTNDVILWRPSSDTAIVPDFYPARTGMGLEFRPDVHRPWVPDAVLDSAQTFFRYVKQNVALLGDESRGSNNWILAGTATASGRPLLANDPHLALRSPAIWWGNHITVTGGDDAVDVAGTTFPGIPGVIIGFNQNIAWGVTTATYDVTDVYQETITPGAGGAASTVAFNGAQVPLTSIDEAVPTGSGTYMLHLEVVPHHGPIIPNIVNNAVVPRTGTSALSIKWTGHQPTTEIDAFLALCYARSADEARAATQRFGVGAQNFVFVDRQGNAGYSSHSVIPVRAAGARTWNPTTNPDGTHPCAVLPGGGEAEWTGNVPDAQIPQATLSPTRPFLVTANNDQAGQGRDGNPFDDAVYLGCSWASGWRGERIVQRITALNNRATRADMEAIQGDHRVLAAGRFRPFLDAAFARLEMEWTTPGSQADLTAIAVTLQPRQAALRDAMTRLRAWSLDGASGVGENVTDAERSDSVASTIFHGWVVAMLSGVFADEQSVLNMSGEEGVGFDRVRAALHLLEHPMELHARDTTTMQSALWDDLSTADARETRDLVLVRALDTALTQLARVTMSPDVATWRWGNLHTVRFATLIPSTDSVLSIPPTGDATFPNGFPRHGGIDVVDASQPSTGSYSFSYGSGPSQRFTVEMTADGPDAYNVLPGGQSIDIHSPHHTDEAELWRANRSHRVPYREADVVADAEARLRFEAAR